LPKTTVPDFKRAETCFDQMVQAQPSSARACKERQLVSPAGDADDLRRIQRVQRAYESGGETGYWRESLAMALEGQKQGDSGRRGGGTEIARIYMHLGDREQAIDELERAYAAHDVDLNCWIRVHPEFDPIRSDPRYQKIVRDLQVR
jgi:tetratricopeptide (TPR) repeat protein